MTTTLRPRNDDAYVASVRRRRIIDGAAEAVTLLGVEGVKVADLVKFGTCARKTFYEDFGGKDQCLREVVENAADGALAAAAERGLEGLLDFLRGNPSMARVLLVEAWAVDGKLGVAFTESLAGLLSSPAGIQEELRAGAVVSLLSRSIRERGVEGLPSLEELEPILETG
ncbi:MAG TPA: TetR/AcrR family transcriptional regulator [Solirubrobacterales bacterium]|nr:TetR/AcrR family transcriptional regulator [Solirubrobacterales bacterium]